MARFHFPLDKVMRWRAIEFAVEQSKLKRLGQEQNRLQMVAAALGAERSRLVSSIETLPDPRGEDLRAMVGFSTGLRVRALKLAEQRARCEKDLAVQKQKYNEARQRLKLLEELRERKHAEWSYQQAQELETLAAESYLSNWNREHR